MNGCWRGSLTAQIIMTTVVLFLSVIGITLAQHDGDLRLVGGTSQRYGRLEVYRRTEWVAIYDRGDFGRREALVACRQLGYGTDEVNIYRSGMFGSGSTNERLEWVRCVGNEMKMIDCMMSPCGKGSCSNDRDIGISCGAGTGGGNSYMTRTTGYRRWSGFVVLLIVIPFLGHVYKRRRYGHHSSSHSIIPIPRYHHGRVPLTSLDDAAAAPSPGSITLSYPPSASAGLPPEPMAQVFTHGYVYPPTSPRSTADLAPSSGMETSRSSLPPSQNAPYSSSTCTPTQMTHENNPQISANFSGMAPPSYSEYEEDVSSRAEMDVHQDSTPILGPPPPYEYVLKK